MGCPSGVYVPTASACHSKPSSKTGVTGSASDTNTAANSPIDTFFYSSIPRLLRPAIPAELMPCACKNSASQHNYAHNHDDRLLETVHTEIFGAEPTEGMAPITVAMDADVRPISVRERYAMRLLAKRDALVKAAFMERVLKAERALKEDLEGGSDIGSLSSDSSLESSFESSLESSINRSPSGSLNSGVEIHVWGSEGRAMVENNGIVSKLEESGELNGTEWWLDFGEYCC